MNIWGSKTLRRLALPLAVVSLGVALTAGGGTTLASSGGGTVASDPNAPDPEITAQSISFVLAPKSDDNFQPNNTCGGAPSTLTAPGAATGTFSVTKLSVSQTRCTLAIFTPNSQQGKDLKYSSTPCPVTGFPTPTSAGLQVLSLKSPDKLQACTAPAFLASVNTGLTKATDAAGRTAVHDWAGTSCTPGLCRLFMLLTQKDGDLNTPGLCSAAFYLTGPCTVAVITTGGVASNPGGQLLQFSDNRCPTDSNLSLPPIGDIGESCTNLPFKPADMSMTLPPAMTPNPELQTPVAALPQHSTEVADQAISYELAPVGQFSFDPPNACSIDGIKPVNRCTAEIINIPVGFAGGDVQFPDTRCTFDVSTSGHSHGNNQGDPCFAQPFSPSKGQTAIHSLPPMTCHAPEPAAPVNGVLPAVACRIHVVLTRIDGDFNANNPCGTLSNATTSVSSPCLLLSVRTEGRHEGDDVKVGSSTPVCPSGAAPVITPVTNQPGFDADVTDTCVAGGAVVPPSPPAAGTLGALLATNGPVSIHIPEDPVLGSNQ